MLCKVLKDFKIRINKLWNVTQIVVIILLNFLNYFTQILFTLFYIILFFILDELFCIGARISNSFLHAITIDTTTANKVDLFSVMSGKSLI